MKLFTQGLYYIRYPFSIIKIPSCPRYFSLFDVMVNKGVLSIEKWDMD